MTEDSSNFILLVKVDFLMLSDEHICATFFKALIDCWLFKSLTP